MRQRWQEVTESMKTGQRREMLRSAWIPQRFPTVITGDFSETLHLVTSRCTKHHTATVHLEAFIQTLSSARKHWKQKAEARQGKWTSYPICSSSWVKKS